VQGSGSSCNINTKVRLAAAPHPTLLLHTRSRERFAATTRLPRLPTTLRQPRYSTTAAAAAHSYRPKNMTCLLASSCHTIGLDGQLAPLKPASPPHHHSSSKPHSSASQHTDPPCRSEPSHPRSASLSSSHKHSTHTNSTHSTKKAHAPECVYVRLQLNLLAHPAFTPRRCSLIFNTAQLKGRSPKTQPSKKNIHKACTKQDPAWVASAAARACCAYSVQTRTRNPKQNLSRPLASLTTQLSQAQHSYSTLPRRHLTRAGPACTK
jgi:hypothetical protein